MKALSTWKFIEKNLQQNVPVAILYVLESKGSSPGRQGFMMAISGQGDMHGSVGGGIMEHKFVEMVKHRLLKDLTQPDHESRDTTIKTQIHDKSAPENQSGMICSGEQTILIYRASQKDLNHIQDLIQSLEGNLNGTLRFSPVGLEFSATAPGKNFEFIMRSEIDWEYREKTGYKNQLNIIGGGHCSLALSQLMRSLDFYITVYEDREGLNTLTQNEFAHEIIIVDEYTALENLIPSGPNQYVVIMTFGYRTDDLAIRALLGKQFHYLGVLGSRSKMDKLFNDYRTEGIDDKQLQHIHSPVGLDISSQTPEEIAVSIAAEIIMVKNKVPGPSK